MVVFSINNGLSALFMIGNLFYLFLVEMTWFDRLFKMPLLLVAFPLEMHAFFVPILGGLANGKVEALMGTKKYLFVKMPANFLFYLILIPFVSIAYKRRSEYDLVGQDSELKTTVMML